MSRTEDNINKLLEGTEKGMYRIMNKKIKIPIYVLVIIALVCFVTGGILL